MKFVVAELRLKRCEVYANSAKLSTRMSPNFVVAKLSSQTLRGLRQVCEALNFNALNFTSVKVVKLSSQTLRKSSSFRTLRKLHELCEAFKSNYTSRCAVHSGLHYDFSYALSASDIASPSPEYRWSQSCLAIFGELRILLLFCCAHFKLRKKYDTQMTQILLEEYIFIKSIQKYPNTSAALLFFSTCSSSNSGPSGPVSKISKYIQIICHLFP